MSDLQGGINYLCQRCQQPLRLSTTLYSMDEHTLAELSLPISPAQNIDIASQVQCFFPAQSDQKYAGHVWWCYNVMVVWYFAGVVGVMGVLYLFGSLCAYLYGKMLLVDLEQVILVMVLL